MRPQEGLVSPKTHEAFRRRQRLVTHAVGATLRRGREARRPVEPAVGLSYRETSAIQHLADLVREIDRWRIRHSAPSMIGGAAACL
jgi:hypothetical protein